MKLVDVRPGEGTSVAVSAIYSIILGVPRVCTFTVATATFVQSVGSTALPWAYAGGAVSMAMLGFLYVVLERRYGLRRVSVGLFAAFIFIYAIAGLFLSLDVYLGGVAFALIVLAEAEFTLTNLSFWNFANRTFTVRQAPRLFGFISAGYSLPAILGGAAIPWIVEYISFKWLLVGSMVGHGLAAVWIGVVVSRLSLSIDGADSDDIATSAQPSKSKAVPEAFRQWTIWRHDYLRWVALLLCLQVFVFFAIDNTFYVIIESELGGGDQVASFLGRFLVALGVFLLLFRLGLSGRWRRWFGLRTALLSTPGTLTVLACLALALAALGFEPEVVFGLVVVLN